MLPCSLKYIVVVKFYLIKYMSDFSMILKILWCSDTKIFQNGVSFIIIVDILKILKAGIIENVIWLIWK